MMVYFCLSPRHHSSLLPVPLLSLCYNEERLQAELGLTGGGGGGQRSPTPLCPSRQILILPGTQIRGERLVTEDVPQLSLAGFCLCRCRSPAQMVLRDLGRLRLGEKVHPVPLLCHVPS